MKNIVNKITKMALGFALMLLTLGLTSTAHAENKCKEGDLMCCLVTTPHNNSNSVFNLDSYLTLFNMESGTGFCRERIEFEEGSVTTVEVKNQIKLNVGDTISDFVFGNVDGDKTTLEVYDLGDDNPAVISIGEGASTASGTITITNLSITYDEDADEDGTRGAVIDCSGAEYVTIQNVDINNKPIKPWQIDNCPNFTATNIHLGNSGQGEGAGALIAVTDSLDFKFSNTGTTDLQGLTGTGIEITDSDGYELSGITMQYSDAASASAIGVKVMSSYGNLDTIAVNNTPGIGIHLEDIDDGEDKSDFTSITLSGLSGAGTHGLELINTENFKFDHTLDVTNFDVGVYIEGKAEKNKFTGSGNYIHGNVSVGVALVESSSGSPYHNTIQSTEIVDQADGCGIYLDSSKYNYISGNNLYNNDACGVSVGSSSIVEELADDDVTLLARGQTGILIDINTEFVNGDEDKKITAIELHQIRYDASDASTTATETDETVANQNARVAKSGTYKIGVGALSRVTQIVSTPGVRTSVVAKTKTASGKTTSASRSSQYARTAVSNTATTNSLLGTYTVGDEDCEDCLPNDQNDFSPGAFFQVIAYNASGEVIGVWKGTASTSASDYADTDRPGCYYDDKSKAWYRVYDVESDYDGDGITDWEEDADQDCEKDDGETKVDDDDTDGDGVLDGVETCQKSGVSANCSGSTPTSADSDGDGIDDGVEDANQDGVWDKNASATSNGGETNPKEADTDADGLVDGLEIAYGTDPNNVDSDGDSTQDGADSCPLLSGDELCYYDHCIPVDSAEVSAAVSAGNESFDGEGAVCDDKDGDGICSELEDKNGNCQRDADETDAGNSDTDGDGIDDGVEDYNKSGGTPDDGETNPLSTDSDGDCIADGDEDVNGDGHADLAGGETDPRLVDSDSDGIADGDEDSSPSGACNGKLEDGETKGYLADTDGDGTNDDTDVCPWSSSNGCVVRYCGVNGFSDIDSDADGLTDVQEDKNGDCAWTVSEKEPNPLDADSDDDGLTDNYEDCFGTNPVAADSDGDGRNDYDEVKSSLDQCTIMYNLSDTNPLRAEFGGCSLATNLATKGGTLPIMIMAITTLVALGYKRRYSRRIL